MRFCADGPLIPDDLLRARDEGQVIFFCGAGVSRAEADLPDFLGLATKVVEALGAASTSPARRLVQNAVNEERIAGVGGTLPADRVFSLLEREFEPPDVRGEVARALKPKAGVSLLPHEVLLELSTGPDRQVRIVTTNFDNLFEACRPDIPVHCAPRLPDPRRPKDLVGITHLHGRVNHDYTGVSGDDFILSSADFGRAYLSDGWARDFIRGLMSGFHLVFVGYAADDPPVQYLLEALSSSERTPSKLYAFQSGAEEEATALWRNRGVEAIAYDGAERHAPLWGTLAAWAERARDPDGWHQAILARATAGPSALKPHERGQIKHIVSSAQGTRRLIDADLPAEWLCVFDPAVRFATPYLRRDDETIFDPFEAYGLDDDPQPGALDISNPYQKRDVPKDAWDAFALTRDDRAHLDSDHLAGLRGHYAHTSPRLAPRLYQLGSWLSRVSLQPPAVWWAAAQAGLHPDILDLVARHRQTEPDHPTPTALAWGYLRRSWRDRFGEFDMRLFILEEEAKKAGWSPTLVRRWANLLRPRLRVTRPFYGSAHPPSADPPPALSDIISLTVEYPRPHVSLDVPDNLLSLAVGELRRGLELAAELQSEAGGYAFLSVPPITPDPTGDGDPVGRDYGVSVPFLLFAKMFGRLIQFAPVEARRELNAWAPDFLFERLKVWVAGTELLTPREAAAVLLRLPSDSFWSRSGQRDLLLTLASRWNDLSRTDQTRLIKRLLKGPSRFAGEARADFLDRRAFQSLERLTWLQANGCFLRFPNPESMDHLKAKLGDWDDAKAAAAAASMEGRSGWVGTNTDPTELRSEPLSSLISRALALAGRDQPWVERRPFDGIVKEKPVRVFRALTRGLKKGEYPVWAWRDFLAAEERKDDQVRFVGVVARRLSAIPTETVLDLAYAISTWLNKVGARLAAASPASFDQIWNAVIAAMNSKPEAAGSTISQPETDWVMSAINSPGGKLAEVLMSLDDHKPKGKRGFKPAWLRKVDQLLGAQGHPSYHAAVVFLFNINWFYAHDPSWTERQLISLMEADGESEDVFWAGVMWGSQIPRGDVLLRLKARLLALTAQDKDADVRLERLSGYLLAGWGSRQPNSDERYISDQELRAALIRASAAFRHQLLRQLERWYVADARNWRSQAIHLIKFVWPRQRAAKTPSITVLLCEIALAVEKNFPALVAAIAPFLTKIGRDALFLVRLRHSEWDIVSKHPEPLLTMMHAILPESTDDWPYDAASVVERLVREPKIALDPRAIELRRRLSAG